MQAYKYSNKLPPFKIGSVRGGGGTTAKTLRNHQSDGNMSERRRFRGPSHLVISANWISGTARAPGSLSLHNYED